MPINQFNDEMKKYYYCENCEELGPADELDHTHGLCPVCNEDLFNYDPGDDDGRLPPYFGG